MKAVFEVGKSYTFKDRSINNKVYHCRMSACGQKRLYYDHKGVEYSVDVSDDHDHGFHAESFVELDSNGDSIERFKWNEKTGYTGAFWNPETRSETNLTKVTSLKERLSKPHLRRIEDVVSDISIGLSQIMDELEKRGGQ